MKKNCIPVLLVLVMSGCFGSQTAKRYYQLQIPAHLNVNAGLINRVIYIDTVQTEDLYDDFRVVYRISPYQINYYAYDFWVRKPGVMLRNTLVEFLSRAGVFRRVIDKLADSGPDLILKSRLYVIEEDDSGSLWSARLSMDIEITDFKNPETALVSHRFDRKKPLPEQNVKMLPKIISEILREEMEALIDKLVARIE